ncbi:threonine aldolase family protein [Fundidesulfovibrio terrae]|uniref:threonine aldolase family protein n=1 Tax=Fundidesulfovibrio terrae TaxID=2922866 RepID=UPI001FAEBC34|nr:low specificity L-threonine aldolase [Fundidesulfovibrio terrae]
MRSFASDNNSGVHPRILKAITDANTGHAVGYGDDPWTRDAQSAFRREFGEDARVYFVFLGTAANVLSLNTLARSFNSVICARSAHINVDECGAPERMVGCKLVAVPTPDGKLRPDDLRHALHDVGNEHHNQPRVVSIAQCTELGTVYTPDEVRALADAAHANNMFLHMDGARIANAASALGLTLRQVSRDCGVDVLSFGGTKNGMMYGEAVVFFRPELAREFKFIRKQGMQLASKMRYISAQFSAMLTDGLWRDNAGSANAMARLLADLCKEVPGVTITRKVETNAVFASIPARAVAALQEQYFFYVWNPEPADAPEVRWMCSFDTTEEDVRAFAAALREALR